MIDQGFVKTSLLKERYMSSTIAIEPTSRERVLQAAQKLIIDHGYVDFSMRELAEVSGLAKATIYHHFPDKQTICRSVFDIDLAALRDRIVAAANSSSNPVARIEAIVLELFGPEIERRLAILLTFRELPGLGMQIHDILVKYKNEIITPIAEVILDGISQGVFREVNVDLTVLSLMGMMQSYISSRLMFEPDQPVELIVEHTTDLLLHGINN